MQQKLTFRNERCLYKRKCDFSGKQIISVYSPDSPYTVYDHKEWMSRKWDPLTYGRDFDFSRPFFEQFAELERVVPKISLLIRNCDNSDYVNNEEEQKNCYMTFAGAYCRDCYYGRFLIECTDCVECMNCLKSQLCYECINAINSYHCQFSQSIENCSELMFCDQMIGCNDCIGCVGLRQKKYCVFNEQKTKEQFEQAKKDLLENLSARKAACVSRVNDLKAAIPTRYAAIVNSVDCDGDYISGSKNCHNCFDAIGCEDSDNIWDGQYAKNCKDMMIAYRDELVYNTMGVCLNAYHCLCGTYCWDCQEMAYCQHCFSSKNIFGCIGLQRNQYCILNKQYTKNEYESLLPQLIAHMRKTGEWGEYFPAALSPFAYNETLAQDYFPLTPEQALAKGWKWKKETEGSGGKKTIDWSEVPTDISKVEDSITEEILECQICGHNFRIIPQELTFYHNQGLPLPRNCFNCRYLSRINIRNPRCLWDRKCLSCSRPVRTSYAPERPERVFCEECYLKEVY